jgi:hypothetical protein
MRHAKGGPARNDVGAGVLVVHTALSPGGPNTSAIQCRQVFNEGAAQWELG